MRLHLHLCVLGTQSYCVSRTLLHTTHSHNSYETISLHLTFRVWKDGHFRPRSIIKKTTLKFFTIQKGKQPIHKNADPSLSWDKSSIYLFSTSNLSEKFGKWENFSHAHLNFLFLQWLLKNADRNTFSTEFFFFFLLSVASSVHSPRIVMEGVSFPSLNRVSLSIFAKGSLGLGSLGVPSTLAHLPMVLSHPTMLFKTQQWSYRKTWKNLLKIQVRIFWLTMSNQ